MLTNIEDLWTPTSTRLHLKRTSMQIARSHYMCGHIGVYRNHKEKPPYKRWPEDKISASDGYTSEVSA